MDSRSIILILCLACQSTDNGVPVYDDRAVTGLLSVLDSIARRNPNSEMVRKEIAMATADMRAEILDSLQACNLADVNLQTMIDELLSLDPYRMYFARFTNVSPEYYRQAFNALPYVAVSLPGGLADALYELMQHRAEFGKWYFRMRKEIEVERCIRVAAEFVSPGFHIPEKVYAIYDGNAGSFAESGSAFFNLCSEVITKAPPGERFRNLWKVNSRDLEGVIAHELNHVMTEPIIFARPLAADEWGELITRNIVSEGVAFLCNPPSGFQKELWEDREILTSLVGEMNRMLMAFNRGEVNGEAIRKWYGDLYHEYATSLLERYLQRTYPDSNQHVLAKQYAIFRPDLVHVLGMWMVSRVSAGGKEKEAVYKLLSNPSSLYRTYNATLDAGLKGLAVDAMVVAMVEKE